MSTRQKSLYLSAKLYELAAEFTNNELHEMLKEQSGRNGVAAIRSAIKALLELHSEYLMSEDEVKFSVAPSVPNQTKDFSSSALRENIEPSKDLSLMAMFGDKSVFPAVSNIVEILHIPAKHKESRERYLARVAKRMENFSQEERDNFFKNVAEKINKSPDNFISKWSRLIKEL